MSFDPICLPSDEICDGKDNDCDGEIDEGLDDDGDGDGYNDENSSTSCKNLADDCNDNDSKIHPDAPELCDKIDNNCNGEVDEGLPVIDNDGDGHYTLNSCAEHNDDCNDNDPNIKSCSAQNEDPCDSTKTDTASTVNISDSNLYHEQTLFTIQNDIHPIEFILKYNSLDSDVDDVTKPLGSGWTHNFDIKLEVGNQILIAQSGHNDSLVYHESTSASIFFPQTVNFPLISQSQDGLTYTLTDDDDTIYTFNQAGYLTGIQYRNANPISLSYTDGNLTQITDSHWSIDFAYYTDNTHRINTIKDANDVVHTFTYGDRGNNANTLTKISTPSPNAEEPDIEWNFDYDEGYMTSKADPMGRTSWYEYIPGSDHRLSVVRDPKWDSWTFSYLPDSSETWVEERDGGKWIYRYNAAGQLTEKVDPEEHSFQYTYYSDGRLEKVKKPFDTDEDFTYGQDLTTTYFYDTDNNLQRVEDSNGQSVQYDYFTPSNKVSTYTDQNLKETSYTYEDNGSIKTITRPSELNASGVQTTYDYTWYTNGSIHVMTVREGELAGQPGSEPLRKTSYTYNDENKLISIKNEITNDTTIINYDPVANTRTVTDALSHYTTYKYDNLNRLIEIEYNGGPEKTVFEYWPDGKIKTVTDPNTNTFYYEYDYKGHVIRFSDDLGYTTEYLYGGGEYGMYGFGGDKLAGIIDANNKNWDSTYYLTGKRKDQKDPLLNTITYTYTARGDLKTVTDPSRDANGGFATTTTAYRYNNLGLLWQKIDPLSDVTEYTYYPTRKVHTVTDRNGDKLTYTYFDDGKVSSMTWQDQNDVELGSVSFTYDALSRIKSMTDALGTTNYNYDDPNRTVSVTDPNLFTVVYTYDAAGKLYQITYPGGKTVTYGYTERNQLETVTGWTTENNIATYYYDAGGRLDYLVNFNGTITDYDYDVANRLKLLEHKQTNPETATFARYNFIELDGVGNRKKVDQIEPLLPDMDNTSVNFLYNYTKNRLECTGVSIYSCDNNFTYDAEGQLETKNTEPFTFDYAHRLTGIQLAGLLNAQYSYDGFGNRLKATRDGIDTYYVYDIFGNLLATATEQGNPASITRYYIHGNGLMAMVDNADNVYTYHFNAIGSTVAMTDINQNIVNAYAYEPFGKLTQSETIPQPFKYVGQYGVMHEPNGFYYMRARYYDPEVGRFISEDPIGFAGGTVNLYEYVKNNPVNSIDPSGLVVIADDALIGLTLLTVGTAAYLTSPAGQQALEGVKNDISTAVTKITDLTKDWWDYFKTPNEGEPGSRCKNPGSGQERQFGSDGKPELDIDYDHDHGQGNPHAHNWDRDDNGSPVRGDGYPVSSWPR